MDTDQHGLKTKQLLACIPPNPWLVRAFQHPASTYLRRFSYHSLTVVARKRWSQPMKSITPIYAIKYWSLLYPVALLALVRLAKIILDIVLRALRIVTSALR